MTRWICQRCGVQYPETETPPDRCPICDEERQFVGPEGQVWTTHDALLAKGYTTEIIEHEPGLSSFYPRPTYGIGQRAFLLETPAGNLLWDCITIVDEPTLEYVRARGGIQAIAISHPHYYSSMIEWSDAFGGAPVYIHANDRQWVQRPTSNVVFWEGLSTPLFGELTLICPGGHFDGGIVAHWPGGADGRGVLMAGDILQVVQDRRWVSFMYSYPNLIPLSASQVQRIADIVRPYEYDRLYGAFPNQLIPTDAHEAVERSAQRYIEHLNRPKHVTTGEAFVGQPGT